jgi:hypothetical protein
VEEVGLVHFIQVVPVDVLTDEIKRVVLNSKISTESLTFLLGIAIGLLGVLTSIELTTKSVANVSLGVSVTFFMPILAKRVLLESVELDDPYSAALDRIFVPAGLMSLGIGTGAVCIGIETTTGVFVCCFGAAVCTLYSIVALYGHCYAVVNKSKTETAADQRGTIEVEGGTT